MCKKGTFSNAGNSVLSFITDKDEIVTPSHQNLHFQTDFMQKTFFGGLISLGVTVYVLSVAYARGRQMLQYEDPSNASIE